MDYSKPPPAAKKIIGAESLPGGEDEHANLGYYKFNRFMAGPLPYHSVCESRGKVLVPLVTLRSKLYSDNKIKVLSFQRVWHAVCHGRRGLR